MSVGLAGVSRATLGNLRDWVAQAKLAVPLRPLALRQRGVEHDVAKLLVRVLGELSREPLLAILDTLIHERDRNFRERPRLLWTGPEATTSGALDTRVKLLELLDGVERSVLWAGYRFDDQKLLAPLHQAMRDRDVDVTVVLDTDADGPASEREARIAAAVAKFFSAKVWAWTDHRPRVYVDPRTAGFNPQPSDNNPKAGYFAHMHAKTVVFDAQASIVGSANFTDAGTTRNIEAGVVVDSREFAELLLRQWNGLIAAGLLRKVADSTRD